MSNFLHGRTHGAPRYKRAVFRSKLSGRLFEAESAGYDPKRGAQLYTLRDPGTGSAVVEVGEIFLLNHHELVEDRSREKT